MPRLSSRHETLRLQNNCDDLPGIERQTILIRVFRRALKVERKSDILKSLRGMFRRVAASTASELSPELVGVDRNQVRSHFEQTSWIDRRMTSSHVGMNPRINCFRIWSCDVFPFCIIICSIGVFDALSMSSSPLNRFTFQLCLRGSTVT